MSDKLIKQLETIGYPMVIIGFVVVMVLQYWTP